MGGHEAQIARLAGLLAPLPLSARPAVLQNGLGVLSPRERRKLAQALDRWATVRAGWPALGDFTIDELLDAAAGKLLTDVHDAGGRLPHGWLTSREQTGQITPRPVALLARRVRQTVRDARAARRRQRDIERATGREQAASRGAEPDQENKDAATSLDRGDLPGWVHRDPTGRLVFRETHDRVHLACTHIPDPTELTDPKLAAALRLALIADGRHLSRPGVPPVAINLLDDHGTWALITLRRPAPELDEQDRGPRHPVLRRRGSF